MIEREYSHSPERLDTLIARSIVDPREAATITRDNLWEHVSVRSIKNRMGAALINALDRANIAVPEFAAMTMRSYREHLTAKNVYQITRVLPIFHKLNEANIPFLLLKGAALNAVLFDDDGIRGMDDIDILIHPEDADRADKVLRDAGCGVGEDLVSDDFYPRFYYEREYLTPSAPPVKIDLHVRPFRPLRYAQTVPNDTLWDDVTRIDIDGVMISIPNPTNMLIHLCVHAACHGAMHVRWMNDIYSWWKGYGDAIDPQALAAKCRHCHLTWPMKRALEKTAEVFDAHDTMQPLLTALGARPNWRDRLALWQAPHDVDRPAAGLVASLLTTPGWRFRFGYARAVIVPSKGHLRQIYPYQHPGWQIAAHTTRVWRTLTKPFRKEDEEAA